LPHKLGFTSFVAILAWLSVLTKNTVTTPSKDAIVQTTVGIVLIAIVTFLTELTIVFAITTCILTVFITVSF
tara:strand:+ start:365 stop:580 length:216 start_codon:yes stop_codon:yes gene_type:complete